MREEMLGGEREGHGQSRHDQSPPFTLQDQEEKQKKEAAKKEALEKLQAEATEKQIRRTELMGELLRSKGFFWMATSNDVIGLWQQAGNVIRSVD